MADGPSWAIRPLPRGRLLAPHHDGQTLSTAVGSMLTTRRDSWLTGMVDRRWTLGAKVTAWLGRGE